MKHQKVSTYYENDCRSSYGHTYSKYKKSLSIMMLLCIKQHLFQFMKKLRNTEAELKKGLLIKKCVVWVDQYHILFSQARLKVLSKDLILIYDQNNFIRCEGRLKHAPLPYDTKTSYLLNFEHYLSELIVKYLHTK